MTKYFIDKNGKYIGAFEGADPPANAIGVPSPPADARQVWDGGKWGAVPFKIPDRVSARQFKLQLLAAGLTSQVEGWVAGQSQAVQIAYDNSSTFDRTDAMLQSGFTALGFTAEQIDTFFTEASTL